MYEDFFGEWLASSKSSKRPRRLADDDDEMEEDGASDEGANDNGDDDTGSEHDDALDGDDNDNLGFDDLLNAAPRRAADLLGDDDDEASGSSGSEAVGASALRVSTGVARLMGLIVPMDAASHGALDRAQSRGTPRACARSGRASGSWRKRV